MTEGPWSDYIYFDMLYMPYTDRAAWLTGYRSRSYSEGPSLIPGADYSR